MKRFESGRCLQQSRFVSLDLKINVQIPNTSSSARFTDEMLIRNKGVNVAHHIPEQAETSRPTATVDTGEKKISVQTCCLGLQKWRSELEPLGAIKSLRIAQHTLKKTTTHKQRSERQLNMWLCTESKSSNDSVATSVCHNNTVFSHVKKKIAAFVGQGSDSSL